MPDTPLFYPIRMVLKAEINGKEYGVAGHSDSPQVMLEDFDPRRHRQQWKLHFRSDGFFLLINEAVDQALTVPRNHEGPLRLQSPDPEDLRQGWTFDVTQSPENAMLLCRHLSLWAEERVPTCYLALPPDVAVGSELAGTALWSRSGPEGLALSMTPPDGNQEYESVYVCFESVVTSSAPVWAMEGETSTPQVNLQPSRPDKTSQHWRLAMTDQGRFHIVNDDVDQLLTHSSRANVPLRLQARDPGAGTQEWWIMPFHAYLLNQTQGEPRPLILMPRSTHVWAGVNRVDHRYEIRPGAPVLGSTQLLLYEMNEGLFWRFVQPEFA